MPDDPRLQAGVAGETHSRIVSFDRFADRAPVLVLAVGYPAGSHTRRRRDRRSIEEIQSYSAYSRGCQ